MVVAASAVAQSRQEIISSLAVVAEATIPLNGGFPARFLVFRDGIGGTPLAIIVGQPDFAQPVSVRLHSACLTGDVFGSRRCDCGDQLRLALPQLEQHGGGIILYLEQEGRGLGLANKIRAYQLQDAGLDTVDANTALGFDDDERDYGVAVRMSRRRGWALRPATSATNFSTSAKESRDTTRSTRPPAWASFALIGSPLTIMRRLFSAPTARGNRCVPPAPGSSPIFTSGRPSVASGVAMR